MKTEIKTNMILGFLGVASGILSIISDIHWLIWLPFIISFGVFYYNLDIFNQIKKEEVKMLKEQLKAEQEKFNTIAQGEKYH